MKAFIFILLLHVIIFPIELLQEIEMSVVVIIFLLAYFRYIKEKKIL